MEFTQSKAAFNRLKAEKREMILKISVCEFANEGFNSANINIIAQKANVSVGAMYKYFDSKRALYLTCVEHSISHLTSAMESIIDSDDDFIVIIERIIRAIQYDCRVNKEFTKLYYEMATEGNAEYAMSISKQIEGVTASLYTRFIKKAQQNDGLRDDIDPRFFALFMDNMFMMLQFSYSCDYYNDRMKIYTDKASMDDDDMVVEQLLKFISGALYLK